jgi:hypothetical protein
MIEYPNAKLCQKPSLLETKAESHRKNEIV